MSEKRGLGEEVANTTRNDVKLAAKVICSDMSIVPMMMREMSEKLINALAGKRMP
jgi:hypothetical protein